MTRVRARQTLEHKKSELNPFANDVKTAILQTNELNLPIERVIYVNDNNFVKHEPGSNRYYVNFPETFMTTTNQKKIIGIRSIQLRHSYKRTLGFTLQFKYYEESLFSGEIKEVIVKEPFICTYQYDKDTSPDMSTWITEINKDWSKLGNWAKEYVWEYSFNDKTKESTIELKAKEPDKLLYYPLFYEVVSFTPDLVNTNASISSNEYVTRLESYPSLTPKLTIPGPLETNDDYLIAASFVEQTSHNYLGFTNTTFTPPKYYHLTSTDNQFWIDLVSPDGLNPIELPTDGRDLLTIEIQLLTQPNIQKF